MKFQTFSIVVGNEACNANCDFCVAAMTPGIVPPKCTYKARHFRTACRLAEKCGVTTALLTGKGEPTLFPDHLGPYIKIAEEYFPLIELQTNGLAFTKRHILWEHNFKEWQGLTTVALSIVHYDNNMNRRIYCDRDGETGSPYPPLQQTIDFLHECGLSVRLNCIGLKGYIDTPEQLQRLLYFAQASGHEMQVTWRPVAMPDESRNNKVAQATRELLVPDENITAIRNWVASEKPHAPLQKANLLFRLPHGAEVFDVGGQNLCLANCLTRQPDSDIIRQLIYANGHIRYDWCYKGALIL